jgi:uncharacterized protein (DUF433 family)
MKTKPEISSDGRIAGTRLTVWDVVPFLERGRSLEYIANVLPLSLEELEAAVEYIDANRDHVNEVHQQIEAQIRRGNSPEIECRVEQTRKRMEEWLRRRRENGDQSRESENATDGAAG